MLNLDATLNLELYDILAPNNGKHGLKNNARLLFKLR